ncbi:DUF3168 domain-containing protein [Oricola nitratireducens]|uniref:DUF3168 domain-containing protein n=1 Tax=Oricola nitratireducens TaxID=2775868 RepID=UPI00186871C0|nr:DUF3168 domain-containing protein [Oricola nitratireducens]
MSSAAHDLQAAIVAALRADTDLVALLGGEDRILDRVPPDRALPCVVIGRTAAQDWSTDDRTGEEHLVTIRGWSRATGRTEVLAVAERVTAALVALAGVSGDTRIVSCLPVSTDHGYEPADRAWRATIRLRALTEPAA